jgi:hypothetical protein
MQIDDTTSNIIAERLSWAMQPGNLALLPHGKIGKAEYLVALGWAGIGHKRESHIFRLIHRLDRRSYEQAMQSVRELVSHMAARKKWEIKPHRYRQIAEDAISYLLDPSCRRCHGRGFIEIEGTGRLSDQHCPACQGIGKRAFPNHRVREVVGELEQFEASIASGVARYLR